MLFLESGLGATTTLTKGKDFNCNASICYAIGPANQKLFQDLQIAVNRFAGFGRGFSPITVDGFIGDRTVAAVQAATAIAGLPSPGITREGIATGAPALLANLQSALDDLDAFGVSIPGSPSQPMIPTPMQPSMAANAATALPGLQPSAAAAVALLPPKTKTPTWVWITVGVSAVAVIGGISYALMHKPKQQLGSERATRKSLSPAQRDYIKLFEQDVRTHPEAYKAIVRADPAAYAIQVIGDLDDADVREFTRDLRKEMRLVARLKGRV